LHTKRNQSNPKWKIDPQTAQAATSRKDLSSKPASRVRVTIVDDEPDIHRAIKFILETSHEFVFAGSYLNGAEAIQGIIGHPPDLVLMDVRLPDVSGIECTRQLSLALPQLRIVMISALDDRQTVSEALDAGCHNYLTKPFVSSQFLTLLRCAMASRNTAGTPNTNTAEARACPLRRASGNSGCGSIREREANVLDALCKGRFYKEIADDLKLSQSMIHKLAHLAFRKLGVNSRHQAVAQWTFCLKCQHLVIRVTASRGRRKASRESDQQD
jgi:DNA-binding NarL/FixJ family response regulator